MSSRAPDPDSESLPNAPIDPAPGRPAGAVRGAPTADDGVLRRVHRRTARASVAPAAVGLALALTGWGWPGWFEGAGGAVIGVAAVTLCALAAVLLARRARLWAAAVRAAAAWHADGTGDDGTGSPPAAWATAVCGEPQPMFRPGRSALWRRARRYPAHIVALRAAAGPLAAGAAVTVHGRSDGLLPDRGDSFRVHAVSERGPFLLGRPADGALFAADRWIFTSG